MRLTRVHCSEPLAGRERIRLDRRATHHLLTVLRLRRGDPVVLFDGRGGEYPGLISTNDKHGMIVQIERHVDTETESTLPIVLVQAVARGSRMDLTVQKTTELGVREIRPVLTSRSTLRLAENQAATRRAHWQSVAVAACEQCGRNFVPTVALPQRLPEYLRGATEAGLRVMLDAGAAPGLAAQAPPTDQLHLLCGPEGGLTAEEKEAARAAGFAPVRLGPRVLRTETAAITAVAVLQALWGDLLQ